MCVCRDAPPPTRCRQLKTTRTAGFPACCSSAVLCVGWSGCMRPRCPEHQPHACIRSGHPAVPKPSSAAAAHPQTRQPPTAPNNPPNRQPPTTDRLQGNPSVAGIVAPSLLLTSSILLTVSPSLATASTSIGIAGALITNAVSWCVAAGLVVLQGGGGAHCGGGTTWQVFCGPLHRATCQRAHSASSRARASRMRCLGEQWWW